jgi:hypothetical protein
LIESVRNILAEFERRKTESLLNGKYESKI